MIQQNCSNLSDEELVKKSLENVDFFAELIKRYEGKLKIYIIRISAFSADDAKEILQEVFLKAWENLKEFDSSLKFSSWIYRIAHNQTISTFRKHKSRGYEKKIPLDAVLFDLVSPELKISEKIDQKTRARLVHTVLKSLFKPHREVLVLKYFENKNYEEISDILKKPMGTVAALLNRAKKDFKAKLPKNIT